jgi:hypothetical protein
VSAQFYYIYDRNPSAGVYRKARFALYSLFETFGTSIRNPKVHVEGSDYLLGPKNLKKF